MADLLTEVAGYLRLDDDDPTLPPLIEAATDYIARATGIVYDGSDSVYTTAIKMLTSHWYDTRGALAASAMEVPYSVETLINHIKLCGDYRDGS